MAEKKFLSMDSEETGFEDDKMASSSVLSRIDSLLNILGNESPAKGFESIPKCKKGVILGSVKQGRTEVQISKETNPGLRTVLNENMDAVTIKTDNEQESKYNTLNSLILSTFGSLPADPCLPVDEDQLYGKIAQIKIGLEEFGTAVMNSTRRLMNFVPSYTSCSSEKYDSTRAAPELDSRDRFCSYQATRLGLEQNPMERQEGLEKATTKCDQANKPQSYLGLSEQKNEEMMDKFSEVIDSLKTLIKTLPTAFRKKVASDIRAKIFDDYNSKKMLDVLSTGTEKLRLETIYESQAQDEKDETTDSLIKRNLQSSYVFLNLMEESERRETPNEYLACVLENGGVRPEKIERDGANWSENLEFVLSDNRFSKPELKERDSTKGYFTFSLNEICLETAAKEPCNPWGLIKPELQSSSWEALGSDVLNRREDGHLKDKPSQPSTPSKFRRRPSLNTPENKKTICEETVSIESLLIKQESGSKQWEAIERRSSTKGGKVAQRLVIETAATQKGILFKLENNKENAGPINQSEACCLHPQSRSYLKQKR